jgi:glycosyltransferase involved in cell wall biosynthesis
MTTEQAVPTVRMLGTRGVPANHGGFETAAERIGLYLAEQGWRVVVYCQAEPGTELYEDSWKTLERVHVPARGDGPGATMWFDLQSIRHAARHRDLCLTFGYNTAVFNVVQRLKGIPNVINMDGIEWKRDRWGALARAFFYGNERFGALAGNHLIADHPEIERHLTTRVPASKVTMIAYGADAVADAPTGVLDDYGLSPKGYLTLIARPVEENSILDIVTAFSRRPRGRKLVVLGSYDPDHVAYHRAVLDAAGDEILFPGAIYDPELVQTLRFHSLAYVHGHTVGGTNPSLVEALGCGNPVIAHDNVYNRWVAADAGLYFRTADDLDALFERIASSPELVTDLSRHARARHQTEFTWPHIARQYDALLRRHLPVPR